jgi:CBS domain-containing protein
VTLAVVRGVPLRVHFSTAVALPFFAWLAAGRMRLPVAVAGLDGGALLSPWRWALLLCAGLVVAVLMHEGAHALAGRACGGRVGEITFLLLGGCTRVAGLPSRQARIAVAAAGPAVSLGAGLLLTVAGLRLPLTHLDARYALALLGQVQLAFGGIDLLPAPPLDGGRMLEALLERPLGRARAARHVAQLGKALAGLMAIIGALLPSLVLIGVAAVLWAGAEQSGRAAFANAALDATTVRALLLPAPWIEGHETVAALAARMRHEQAPRFVVTDGGTLAGVVSAADVGEVEPADRASMHVFELIRPAPSVQLDQPLSEARALMRSAGVSALPVVDCGALVGMITDAALRAAEELCALDLDLASEPDRADANP